MMMDLDLHSKDPAPTGLGGTGARKSRGQTASSTGGGERRELDRVVVNLLIETDLDDYAEKFDLPGRRSARDDLKRTVLDVTRSQLERMGIPRNRVNRQRQ